jgi:membrane protease YdiL (CAAX protease family)
MIRQWKPSLAIAALLTISTALGFGGRGIFNPYAVTVFCQLLVGFALAGSIRGYEPLPVTRSIIRRERAARAIGNMIGISLLLVLLVLMVEGIVTSIGQQVFGETNHAAETMGTFFPSSKWQTFFLLLSGAGIGEETPYRLVFLSLFWRLTGHRWVAIILSAVLFGAYHLTPLDTMYRVFLQFPISVFLASSLIGTMLGYVFVKRGYETAVFGHTLSDWIPYTLSGAG